MNRANKFLARGHQLFDVDSLLQIMSRLLSFVEELLLTSGGFYHRGLVGRFGIQFVGFAFRLPEGGVFAFSHVLI